MTKGKEKGFEYGKKKNGKNRRLAEGECTCAGTAVFCHAGAGLFAEPGKSHDSAYSSCRMAAGAVCLGLGASGRVGDDRILCIFSMAFEKAGESQKRRVPLMEGQTKNKLCAFGGCRAFAVLAAGAAVEPARLL